MSATHTPGPWTCFYKHKYDEWHVSVPLPQSTTKWALFDDGVRSENPEADARLIAAAPDLLDALTMVRDADNDCIKDGLPTIPPAARLKIDAAIAKTVKP